MEQKPNDPAERVPCSSCGAPILFVRTPTGALQPLDADPVKDGNIVVRDGSADVAGIRIVGKVAMVLKGDLFEGDTAGEPRYRSHYSTCPDAAKHRKRKGKK